MQSQFFLALSFLSRLVPGHEATEHEMAASIKWYPLAGLLMGLVLVLPFALGLAGGKPLLQGVCFTLFYLWLTRALHWDGLADLFDALGSGKHGDGFTAVMKDSRCGVFGVAAVAAGLAAFVIGASYSFEFGYWPVPVFAIVLGRSAVSPLACLASPAVRGGLGRIVYAGSGGQALLLALIVAPLTGFICAGFWATLAVFAAAGAIIWYISRVAGREGGLSGDYFGAAIVMVEIATLLVCAWLYQDVA